MRSDSLRKISTRAVLFLFGGVVLTMLISPVQAEVSPSLGAAVSGSFQAHLHVGGDPNSSGAASTSDIIFSNIDKYGTLDFDAGPTTVLSEPSLLIVDTADGDRLYGVSYAPIEAAVNAKISNFVIENGDLKIKDSSSPAKEHKVSLAALSSALDIKSIYTANDKLTANRSVSLDNKILKIKGKITDFDFDGTNDELSIFRTVNDHKVTISPGSVKFSASQVTSSGGQETSGISHGGGLGEALRIYNSGSGGIGLDSNNDNTNDVVLGSDGSLDLKQYGKNTFKGDASKDYILSVDDNGNLRELTVSDLGQGISSKRNPQTFALEVAKNLPEKSVPASALPDSALTDKRLSTDNQQLTEDRSVTLDSKILKIKGKITEFDFDGTNDELSIFRTVNKHKITLTPGGVKFSASQVTSSGGEETSGLSHGGALGETLRIYNSGSGGIGLDSNNDNTNDVVLGSDGSLDLKQYGQNTFKGDGSKDYVLSVDASGNVRELSLTDIAKNLPGAEVPASAAADIAKKLPEKSVPASALPDSAFTDKRLSTDNQQLTADRSVNLDKKTLTFKGDITEFDFDGTNDELSIFRTVNAHKITISPGSVKFSASQATSSGGEETSGISHGGGLGEAVRIYNSGSGGIGLDSNNDNTNDVVLGSDGSLDLKQYGQNTFKGDASKDYVLSVDASGNVRELSASVLGTDTSLAMNNQTLAANRSVNLDGKVLTFNGANRDFAIDDTSFKITDLSDKTGKTNTTLTSTDLQLNVGDKKGARLSRSKDANAAFTVTNTGTGGVAFDVDGNGAADAIITVSKFGLKSIDGKGTFLFNRGDTVNGGVAFRNLGTGSFTFNPGDSGKSKFEIVSSGSIKLPYYGEATSKFPGDAKNDRVLAVDGNGNLRELTLDSLAQSISAQSIPQDLAAEVAKNLPEKSIPAKALPDSAFTDKRLSTDNQQLTADRSVNLDKKILKFKGDITEFDFDGTNDELSIFRTVNKHRITLTPGGVKFSASQVTSSGGEETSGLFHGGALGEALRIYNSGSGGIGLDSNNDKTNDIVLRANGAMVVGDPSNNLDDHILRVNGKAMVTDSILSPIVRVTSDRRLKEDIQPFNDGIGIVRQVKTYNFRFKSDADRIKHYGVIAQEIEAIDPSLVSRFTKEEGGVEYLSVHTNSLTYIMLDALKHLDAELAAAKTEMLEMKAEMLARIEALEAAAK